MAMQKKPTYGILMGWAAASRLVVTGKADLLQRQKLQRSAQNLAVYKQERDQTDIRKLVMKPLAKHCKGQVYSDKLQSLLAGVGLEGVQSVSGVPPRSTSTLGIQGVEWWGSWCCGAEGYSNYRGQGKYGSGENRVSDRSQDHQE